MFADAIPGQPRREIPAHTQSEGDGEVSWIIDGSRQVRSRPEIHSTGYVVRTLEAALWSVARTGCCRSAVVLAANWADDTDMVAAVTRRLANSIHDGLSGIPEHRLGVVAREDRLLKSAHRLLKPVARGAAHTPDTAADGRDAPMRGPAGLHPSCGIGATDLGRQCPVHPSGAGVPDDREGRPNARDEGRSARHLVPGPTLDCGTAELCGGPRPSGSASSGARTTGRRLPAVEHERSVSHTRSSRFPAARPEWPRAGQAAARAGRLTIAGCNLRSGLLGRFERTSQRTEL